MKNKIGLKLFSSNIIVSSAVAELLAKGQLDYIELLALPGTFEQTIKYWQSLPVPYIIHVPHAGYGFNLSNPNLREQNIKIFVETQKFADNLKAQFMIIHPGLAGEITETISQIQCLKDKRLMIENKPFISLFQTRCVGSSPEEIKKITEKTGVGFCLDIVHAVKSAFANGKNHINYIKEFLSLNPQMVHLCDCKLAGCFDEHLSFGEGEIDFPIVLALFLALKHEIYFTLETPVESYGNLDDFKTNRLLLDKYSGVLAK